VVAALVRKELREVDRRAKFQRPFGPATGDLDRGPEAPLGLIPLAAPNQQLAADSLDLGREEGVATVLGDRRQDLGAQVDVPFVGRRLRQHTETEIVAPGSPSEADGTEPLVEIVAEAGLADRIECVAGDVLTDPWPARTDVLLLSYVVSSYSQQALRRLLAQTHQHLPAGGRLIIHDFALHADRPGPRSSAQWFFANLSISAHTHPHTVLEIVSGLEAAGYAEVTAQPHVPDVTFLFTARKAA
jgi:hypothetical protein